ncbi:MAG: hypothetical protein HRT45_00415 [Bdellovibrionales bacterium]|nr:hypothetical protein [Bdellovibrionales bacterium]
MKFIAVLIGIIWITGCGVKGDPLPPEDAPKLGRGTPTYSRAVDDLEIDKQKIEQELPEEEEQENEEL